MVEGDYAFQREKFHNASQRGEGFINGNILGNRGIFDVRCRCNFPLFQEGFQTEAIDASRATCHEKFPPYGVPEVNAIERNHPLDTSQIV